MRPSLYRANIVRKTVNVLGISLVVLHGHFQCDVVFFLLEIDDLFVERAFLLAHVFYKGGNASLIEKLGLFIGPFVFKRYCHALIEKGHFSHAGRQNVIAKNVGLFEYVFIRPERDAGSRGFRFADGLEFRDRMPLLVFLVVYFSVPFYFNFQPFRKPVNNADAYPVKSSGNLVNPVVKFAPGVERGHYDFYRRFFLCVVYVHGDPAAVVSYRYAFIRVYGNIYLVAIAPHNFVDRVVHNLVNKVVQAPFARVADIHGGSFSDGLDPLQDLYRPGVIFLFCSGCFFGCVPLFLARLLLSLYSGFLLRHFFPFTPPLKRLRGTLYPAPFSFLYSSG